MSIRPSTFRNFRRTRPSSHHATYATLEFWLDVEGELDLLVRQLLVHFLEGLQLVVHVDLQRSDRQQETPASAIRKILIKLPALLALQQYALWRVNLLTIQYSVVSNVHGAAGQAVGEYLVLVVKEDLEGLGAVHLAPGALAHDLRRVHNVLHHTIQAQSDTTAYLSIPRTDLDRGPLAPLSHTCPSPT